MKVCVDIKLKFYTKKNQKNTLEKVQENQNGITNDTFSSFIRFLSTITPKKYWEMVKLKRDKNVGDENKKKDPYIEEEKK